MQILCPSFLQNCTKLVLLGVALWSPRNALATELSPRLTAEHSDPPLVVLSIVDDINRVDPSIAYLDQLQKSGEVPPPDPSKGKQSQLGNKSSAGAAAKWRSDFGKQSAEWRSGHAALANGWQKKHAATLALWRKAHEAFLKEIPMHRANLGSIVGTVVVPDQALAQPISKAQFFWHAVPSAFSVPIKDQGDRGTCAAFAAIRTIEVLLAQNGRQLNLSEQYFYWASRPECRASPCGTKGSWAEAGFEFSIAQEALDIPAADMCPYIASPIIANDTQAPLSERCQSGGRVRVVAYDRLESLDGAVAALHVGEAVVAALSLSDNVFSTKGFVAQAGAGQLDLRKDHAKGHAVTFVGYVELPKSIQPKEGRYCMLTANSWGIGWGQGGYACLSESWIKAHRLPVSFLAVKKIDV